MRTLVLALCGAAICTGCVNSPSLTRSSNPNMYEPPRVVQIQAGRQQELADCIRDGFSSSHLTMTNISVRSERRDDGHRVEAVIGKNIVAASVDITLSGEARLVVGKFTSLIDLSGERAAFESCTSRFAAGG